MRFERNFVQADNSPGQTTGSIPLPDGITKELISYVLQQRNIVISPDGLRIGEFPTSTSTYFGTATSYGYNLDTNYNELVITLGPQPSLATNVVFHAKDASNTARPTGSRTESTNTSTRRIPVGYFMGKYYAANISSVGAGLVDYLFKSTTTGNCSHGAGTSIDSTIESRVTALGDGSITGNYSWIPKSRNYTFVDDKCWDAAGIETSSSYSKTYTSDVEDPVWTGKTSSVFVNHRIADAIASVDGGFATFRNTQLVSDAYSTIGYIYDSSPLGEVFVATSDMRVVIHEPLAGGMKKIVIPPNVVKLLAALWL